MLDPDHTLDAASLVEAITVSAGDRVAIDTDDDCHIDTGGLRPPLACPSPTLPRRSPRNNPPGSAGDNITDGHARTRTATNNLVRTPSLYFSFALTVHPISRVTICSIFTVTAPMILVLRITLVCLLF